MNNKSITRGVIRSLLLSPVMVLLFSLCFFIHLFCLARHAKSYALVNNIFTLTYKALLVDFKYAVKYGDFGFKSFHLIEDQLTLIEKQLNINDGKR